ncbi:MAG TPA: sigma-70 family RNA polymerase sigma factor [Vicinamibacteria bacterium]|nr:sigma-70 family RNA polymerase sigma factor [Vicinamibacteria bacterium]
MDGVRLLSWLMPAVETCAVDWDEVFREELPRLFNYFRYRGFDRASAEDLTSIAFEKAWRARDRYRRERAAVTTWLLAIARHAATDHLRRLRREVPLDFEPAPAPETPESAALRADERRRLRALLAGLSPRERELIALKYGAGVTNRAIATLTGLGESNVGTILHRTIASLRARWDEGGGTS